MGTSHHLGIGNTTCLNVRKDTNKFSVEQSRSCVGGKPTLWRNWVNVFYILTKNASESVNDV